MRGLYCLILALALCPLLVQPNAAALDPAAPAVSGGGGDFVEITPAVRKATDKALRWLIKAQNRDGSWGISRGTKGDITCTSLACMALMAGGNNQRTGPDSDAVGAVRRGLEYIMKIARRNPRNIASSTTTLVQNKLGKEVHNFFGVVFLSQAYGMEQPWITRADRDEIRDLLSLMCDRISRTQDRDGSWHKNTFGGLKGTCMAWIALRSAHSAGISVEDASVQKTVNFINKQYNKSTGFFNSSRGGFGGYQTLYASSSCLRVLHGMGQDTTTVPLDKAYASIYKFVSKGGLGSQFLSVEGEDYLAAAMITQAMLMAGGAEWKEWFTFIRTKLMKRQNGDGSWTGTACISGKVFSTCCSLLALQAPYRLLPMQDL